MFMYLSNYLSFFITKYIHLVLSKYLLYILISVKNMHKSLNFYYLCNIYIFETLKYLKSCLPKGKLLDTTILLVSTSFIEVGLLY